MKIKEGDKLPDAKVLIIDMDNEYKHKEISTSEILNKEKIRIITTIAFTSNYKFRLNFFTPNLHN